MEFYNNCSKLADRNDLEHDFRWGRHWYICKRSLDNLSEIETLRMEVAYTKWRTNDNEQRG